MIILGIDPGYAIMGYGVIEKKNAQLRPLDCGVVKTEAALSFPQRLSRVFDGISMLIAQYKPDEVAFEELFFYRNVTTAMKVGAGRGVAILAAQRAELPLYEYTPMQIKLGVTGNGHADKQQVQHMVRAILCLRDIPKPDDAADALAVAICHANTSSVAAEQFIIR